MRALGNIEPSCPEGDMDKRKAIVRGVLGVGIVNTKARRWYSKPLRKSERGARCVFLPSYSSSVK